MRLIPDGICWRFIFDHWIVTGCLSVDLLVGWEVGLRTILTFWYFVT